MVSDAGGRVPRPVKQPRNGDEYRYEHFSSRALMDDLDFYGGPRPGEMFPACDLPTVTGERLRIQPHERHKPRLIVMGSVTCPMTAASMPGIKRLYQRFGRQVEFVHLYVREAHPGERFPQPRSFEQKMDHAQRMRSRDGVPWAIAVDDVDGTLHRKLDLKHNSAYLLDRDGRVAFRTLWADDERMIGRAIESVLVGESPPVREHRPRFGPMLSGMGEMRRVVHDSGPTAERDVMLNAPPMYGLAWLADRMRPLPLPARQRSAAAVVVTAAAAAGVGAIALLAARQVLRSGRR